jgi:hypothetical protein
MAYKFAIKGTLLVDGVKHESTEQGLIIEDLESAKRIAEVIGSKYITLNDAPKKPKSRAKGKGAQSLPSED